jgi:endonuclease/exonuclease/phosphatase family metal-dependent hydrolase
MTARKSLLVCIVVLVATLLFGVITNPSSASANAARKSLRVMTYNIHVGVGMDKKLDLERIALVITNEHPDLVGLQEVDRGVKRTELRDEIVELAKLTGMEYAFAHNLDYQGGQYGVAILSRFPIQKVDHRKYENLREAERRGMIRVEIRVDGKLVNFVTTHLDYQYEDGRLFETQQLLKFLEPVKGPLIVVGDFNDEPSGEACKLMLTRFEDSWIAGKVKESGRSYPADSPTKRIDYIFTRRSDRIRVQKAWLVTTLASDHVPVVADLELR